MRPHKVDVSVFDGLSPIVVASAATVDATQHKRLLTWPGHRRFRVIRRYFVDAGEPWGTVYDGDDPDEAVRIYNGMG